MNAQEPPPNDRVAPLGRSLSAPINISKNPPPLQLPYRPIDPSQTLQLPFHESQRPETPFSTLLGESMIIITPPTPRTPTNAKLPSSERTSPSVVEAGAKPRCDGEEKGTWQDGWVKIIDLAKEPEKEKVGSVKKRSKEEWRNEEVEPVKKKSRDYNRSSWVKKQKEEKVGMS